MKTRFLMYLLTLCLSGLQSVAQREGQYTKIDQTVPPAPTAASLGEYGNYKISGYSGTPFISIPLFDIPLKDFNLPVTLSYNASGVKVEDIASWVGLGWSLNAGGVITRSVVDLPDDRQTGADPRAQGFLYNNWYSQGYNPPLDATGYAIHFDPAVTHPSWIQTILQDMRGFGFDTEPDIFYYNFNGKSGKFVLKTNPLDSISTRKVLLMPYQDIKVEFNTSGGQGSLTPISQFIVADEKGNKYYFDIPDTTFTSITGTTEISEGASFDSPGGPDEGGLSSYNFLNSQYCISSWYISKIITINNDTIKFSYVNSNYIYLSPNVQTARIMDSSNLNLNDTQGCALTNNAFATTDNISVNHIYGKRLTNIAGPNFKVEFEADSTRIDIPLDKALTKIKFYNIVGGDTSLIKQFGFRYSYEGDLSNPQIIYGDSTELTYGDSRKRLMLDTLYNMDVNGTIISNYNFHYNDSIPLPDRLSNQKDFWGYFCNNNCGSSIPKLYVYPNASPVTNEVPSPNFRYSVIPKNEYSGTTYILPGADRNTNPVSILSGTLKSIQFPTGGTTTFDFEPHTFNYDGQNIQGGGLRLKRSISYDGINHANDVIHYYSYVKSSNPSISSGVLFNLPVFAYSEDAFTYYTLKHQTNADSPHTAFLYNDSNYYKYNCVRSNVSQASLGAFDGVNVGYSEITDSLANNGKTITKYSVPGAFGAFDDDVNDGYCDIDQSGFCDSYFQPPIPITIYNYLPQVSGYGPPDEITAPLGMDMTGQDINIPYTYPFAPTPNYDWNRGIVISENSYDVANRLAKTVNYHYTLFTPQNTGLTYVKGLKKARLLNYALMAINGYYSMIGGVPYGWNPNEYTFGVARYDVIEPYQLLTQVCKVPASQATYYNDQSSGNTIQDSMVYSYHYNNMEPYSKTHYESDGKVTSIYTKYVADIDTTHMTTIPAMLGNYNMLRNHLINDVVESYTQVTNTSNTTTTTGANHFVYKQTLPKLDSAFVLNVASPLSDFSSSITDYNNYTRDARYEANVIVDKYDTSENILQAHKFKDYNITYLWGYNAQYPVAKIIGSDYTTVSGLIDQNILNNPTNDQQLRNYLDTALRQHLSTAQVFTYTYNPLVGITSQCDQNNRITYYEYDSMGRLAITRDQDGNIIKRYDYHYQTQ